MSIEAAYYIYFTKELVEVHEESSYTFVQGMYHVGLKDPIVSVYLNDTDEQSQELFAKLGEWLAKHHQEQSSSQ